MLLLLLLLLLLPSPPLIVICELLAFGLGHTYTTHLSPRTVPSLGFSAALQHFLYRSVVTYGAP